MHRGVNELWQIDTVNSGENDDYYEYFVDIFNSLNLVRPVRNHGPNRRRGLSSFVAEEKEKDHR